MMKFFLPITLTFILLSTISYSQNKQGVIRPLETCGCQVKIDSSFHTRCAYLIVPENRKKNNGKTIKLPFILVESKNPGKKRDPLMYTAGGPGGSSLRWATVATKEPFIDDRDCIAFEQRGTYFAVPQLWSYELDTAIKESYRKNLNKDSMVLEGVKRYRKEMEARDIDLSGYNTDESVADMDDLLTTLGIDSVNLWGGSYSGGLMMALLQKDRSRVRTLVLDSPLPTFVPIDEEEPANFIVALNVLFSRVDKDSTDKVLYGKLKERFQQYFNSIIGKTFYIRYLEKGTTDSVTIQYTKNELLDIVENSFGNPSRIPDMIVNIIRGNHYDYMKTKLDDLFENNQAPSAMRISVYCADQAAYNNEAIIEQFYGVYPYMKGYHINDVYKAMCNCWNVPPIKKETKQAFYSNCPALLADGEMDNACRPIYIDRIHHYLPNSQRVLFTNRGHMVGGKTFFSLMQQFLNDPFKKLVSDQKDVIVY